MRLFSMLTNGRVFRPKHSKLQARKEKRIMVARNLKSLLMPLVLLLAASALWAQDNSKQFHWSGKLAVDNVVQVKGISGNIDARRAAGDEVEVTADISGPHADEVRVEVVTNADGITVCETYGNRGSSCDQS